MGPGCHQLSVRGDVGYQSPGLLSEQNRSILELDCVELARLCRACCAAQQVLIGPMPKRAGSGEMAGPRLDPGDRHAERAAVVPWLQPFSLFWRQMKKAAVATTTASGAAVSSSRITAVLSVYIDGGGRLSHHPSLMVARPTPESTLLHHCHTASGVQT